MIEALVKVLGGLLIAAGVFLVVGLFVGLPVMLLWNGLVPEIFSLPEIGFLQAMGLVILCGFLFRANVSVTKKD